MILFGGFLLSPLVAVILSAYFFKNYFYEKAANKSRSPQDQVKIGGTLATAIIFCAIGVIFTAFIVMLIIIYNEVMNHM